MSSCFPARRPGCRTPPPVDGCCCLPQSIPTLVATASRRFCYHERLPVSRRAPITHKLSNRISDTGEIFLTDVRVSAYQVLGEVGGGWPVLLGAVNAGRVHVAARSVGIAQGSLELSTAYARERKTFGQVIGRHQLVQQMLVDMALGTETARMLVWRAADALDRDPDSGPYWPSLAKLHASRIAMSASHDAVQIHGAYGLSDEYHVERFFREAKMQEIVDGTSEIQQTIIARQILADAQ